MKKAYIQPACHVEDVDVQNMISVSTTFTPSKDSSDVNCESKDAGWDSMWES